MVIDIPVEIGDEFYTFDIDYNFDDIQSKILEYEIAAIKIRVTNISFSINKKRELKTNIRYCVLIDNKTVNRQYNISFDALRNNVGKEYFKTEAEAESFLLNGLAGIENKFSKFLDAKMMLSNILK